MSEWRSDELSPSEQKAFGALARRREPRAELEESLVAELRRKKLLWRKRVSLWIPLATIAASVLIVCAVLREVRPPHPGVDSKQPHWILLLREGHEDRNVTAEESRRRVNEYASWARSASAKGLIDGEKLREGGTVLSLSGDSPAVRTPASVSGFFLLDAMDATKAHAIAASCPHLHYGGEIELRSIESTGGGDPTRVTPEQPKNLKGLGYTDPDDAK